MNLHSTFFIFDGFARFLNFFGIFITYVRPTSIKNTHFLQMKLIKKFQTTFGRKCYACNNISSCNKSCTCKILLSNDTFPTIALEGVILIFYYLNKETFHDTLFSAETNKF